MDKDLINILKCPICNNSFKIKEINSEESNEIINGSITCGNHDFLIIHGVLDFNSVEQENVNNWSKMYETMKYDELDKYIQEKLPKQFKEIKDKEAIVAFLNEKKPQVIVDIATGRGSLATFIAKNISYSPTIICTDLSFEVLRYDRIKIKELNPNLNINYIACDCTNIPITNSSIDCVVSFYGIVNMNVASKGVKEAYRILKDNSYFLNSAFCVDFTTKKVLDIVEMAKQYNVDYLEDNCSKDGLEKIHNCDFSSIDIITIYEGIGEKNELDLIPVEGEWFSTLLYKCLK